MAIPLSLLALLATQQPVLHAELPHRLTPGIAMSHDMDGQAPTRIRPQGQPAQPSSDRIRDPEAEGQRVMLSYAACIVRRRRTGVERFLALATGSAEAGRAGSRIAISDCLNNADLRFQAHVFRGALYEALFKTDHRVEEVPASFAQVPPIVYSSAPAERLTDKERSWLALHDFADCVVRASPAEARALIGAEVTSDAEAAAFARLQPALGPCLASGNELSFSRPVLRGLVAESLYRLTAAAVPPKQVSR